MCVRTERTVCNNSHFEPPDVMGIVSGDWYHLSLIEDELPASAAFDIALAEGAPTHVADGSRATTR